MKCYLIGGPEGKFEKKKKEEAILEGTMTIFQDV